VSTSSAGAAASATSGQQIVIGLANNEAGPISIPAFRYGALAAVKYINATGGIHGDPVKVDTCIDDGSPEGAIQCANTFVADHAVAYFAGQDTGADSAIPILSGANIPYVSEYPWGSVQAKSPDSFALGTGDTAFNIAPLDALKKAGATSVAAFYYDIPLEKTILPLVERLATNVGIKLIPISISATNPDWTSAVAAAQAAGAQSMWGKLAEAECTNMVKAARAAGFKGLIAAGSCTDYINALGNEAANTLVVWPYWFPQLASAAPASIQAQMKVYEQYMDLAGYGADVNGYATASFGSMVELSEVMKGIQEPVTGPNLLAALRTADVPGFMGPQVDCAAHPYGSAEPAACNADLLLLKVVATKNGPVRQLEQGGYDNTAVGS
jgi:branched-chain amino acid transport system substrate-binding protein